MPQNFSRATIVHWRRPDGKDAVISRECSVIKKSLMLHHALRKGNIIVLAPSTKRMEEKDGIFVSLFHELVTSVFQEKAMSVVKRVTDLESVASIGSFSFNCFFNFFRRHSVLVKSIIVSNVAEEVHFSTYKPVTLCHNVSSHRVVLRETSESSRADLFLAVGIVYGVSNNCDRLSAIDLGVVECDSFTSLE